MRYVRKNSEESAGALSPTGWALAAFDGHTETASSAADKTAVRAVASGRVRRPIGVRTSFSAITKGLPSVCTVIVIQEPGVPFPVVVAANRDERADRPVKPFGRHGEAAWRGGLDVLAGGTWFGLHDSGFGVYMLNGSGALGPEPGLRSRGLLAVDLLEAGSAEAAEDCVLETPPETVRPCHVLIAGPAGVTAFSHPDAAGGSGVWSRRSVEAPISMWTDFCFRVMCR